MKPIKFVAKKLGWSQSDKGFVLRLLIAPDDDWEKIAIAPLGEPFGVVMVAIDPETGLIPEAEKEPKERVPFARMKRAVQSGILCNDPKFQWWLSTHPQLPVPAPDTVADSVRLLCGVISRADLDTNDLAARKWDALVTGYQQATGQFAEVRG